MHRKNKSSGFRFRDKCCLETNPNPVRHHAPRRVSLSETHVRAQGSVLQAAVPDRYFPMCRNKIKLVIQYHRKDTEMSPGQQGLTHDKSGFGLCHSCPKPIVRSGAVKTIYCKGHSQLSVSLMIEAESGQGLNQTRLRLSS